ncbi:MAG: hypothetical protein ACKOAS_07575 [Verrucomicrobiota bacterium]|jgi:hypothetical protein
MKILRATASKDISVHPDCSIVRHPLHGRECVRVGMEHWIPVVSWVRLHDSHGGAPDESLESDQPNGPAGFEELESNDQVAWVEKSGALE